MKQITINTYSFNELTESAKETAISNRREKMYSWNDTAWIYDEAHESVKGFNTEFNVKEGRESWLDPITSNIPEDVLNLTGKRLVKYLLNNHPCIFQDCPFTGICYDYELLTPFRNVLESRKIPTDTFEDLITDAFDTLRISLEKEEEYLYSDEAISESLIANEHQFTEEGKEIYPSLNMF